MDEITTQQLEEKIKRSIVTLEQQLASLKAELLQLRKEPSINAEKDFTSMENELVQTVEQSEKQIANNTALLQKLSKEPVHQEGVLEDLAKKVSILEADTIALLERMKAKFDLGSENSKAHASSTESNVEKEENIVATKTPKEELEELQTAKKLEDTVQKLKDTDALQQLKKQLGIKK